MTINRRTFNTGVAAGVAAMALPSMGFAQAKPIRIGFSIAQTGPLAGGGKTGLIGFEIWRDHVNAAGGVLGRPIEIVAYDDQSSGGKSPGIYAKLTDVDKVDLLLSPYGTNISAPIMPIMKQRNRLIFSMLATGLNTKLNHERFFSMAPWGPDPELQYRGFVDLGHEQGGKTIAILAADGEAQQAAAAGARRMAKQYNMKIVLDHNFPPNTNDFTSAFNQIKQANPELVLVSSYPSESVAVVRAISEVGLPENVKMFGGGMVGLQYASILEALGSRVNGIVNLHTYSVEKTFDLPGSIEFQKIYYDRATAAKVDPLGHLTAPYWYACGQIIKKSVEAAGSLDEGAITNKLKADTFDTIVGPIKFGDKGEWDENRVLMVQYQNVADKNIEQFRNPGKAIIVHPAKYRSGELRVPFAKARA